MKCGIGIRPELFADVFETLPTVGFLEAHSENYFGESIARAKLRELREHYPISLHGVGLSLGRADDLDRQHLTQLKDLVDETEPLLVSEHLAWSAYSHRHVPDLLPLPLSSEALQIMCQHIDQMQMALGRQILVENPSNYLLFDQLQIPEPEFLNALADRTGCGLLLDINNVHVSASNIGRDAQQYIDELNSTAIQQYHLAGYTEVSRNINGKMDNVLIDTHNQTVFEPVWALFEHTIKTHGRRPALFEWDSDFPEFQVILDECEKANRVMRDAPQATKNITMKATPVAQHATKLAGQQSAFMDSLLSLNNHLVGVTNGYQHRIHIYQNNVFAAVQEYLAQVYPATCGVVGSEYFKQLVQEFIQTTPPSKGNVHLYGATLSELLADFPELASFIYLDDLLIYEWALHSAYFATTSMSIDASCVAQEELLVAPVEFNESILLLDSEYPIYEIHRQSLPDFDGEVSISLSQSQDKLLVYKFDHEVQTVQLSAEQLHLLQSIEKNKNLLKAIEALQGSVSAEAMSSTLALVLDKQMLVVVT